MVLFSGGEALIAQNDKYLKEKSLSFQMADVPLILFLLGCSAAALLRVNISFIYEKIHYFSQTRNFMEPRLNLCFHITLFLNVHHGIFSVFVLSADSGAHTHTLMCLPPL